MPDLDFTVEQVQPARFSASPLLLFKLRVRDAAVEHRTAFHSVSLRCQICIEPAQRRYEKREQARLSELFDSPQRWSQTLRPLLWTHTSVIVPPFVGDIAVDLPVPCTYDFNVASAKYFDALESGEVPLTLLFSGTIFYEADTGGLRVAQIPWEKETAYRLPVKAWRDMMNVFYPNTAWLCLRKDVFDRLCEFKRQAGAPTWEQTLERLLPAAAKVK